ncbi:MAG: prepilin-type N-terminal cleavage/methylation domain-containing protein [Caldisericia bacterium]
MKRRGFTLIELMVVIAIIIILAAIAIPNYLRMTERAKKSRLQSDFATLATCLETFKTDWGKYPTAGTAEKVNINTTNIYEELSGTGTATVNVAGQYNAVGEQGPIEYLKAGTLTSMINPFNTAAGNEIHYGSAAGVNWVLYVDTDLATNPYMSRTDGGSTVVYTAGTPSIP